MYRRVAKSPKYFCFQCYINFDTEAKLVNHQENCEKNFFKLVSSAENIYENHYYKFKTSKASFLQSFGLQMPQIELIKPTSLIKLVIPNVKEFCLVNTTESRILYNSYLSTMLVQNDYLNYQIFFENLNLQLNNIINNLYFKSLSINDKLINFIYQYKLAYSMFNLISPKYEKNCQKFHFEIKENRNIHQTPSDDLFLLKTHIQDMLTPIQNLKNYDINLTEYLIKFLINFFNKKYSLPKEITKMDDKIINIYSFPFNYNIIAQKKNNFCSQKTYQFRLFKHLYEKVSPKINIPLVEHSYQLSFSSKSQLKNGMDKLKSKNVIALKIYETTKDEILNTHHNLIIEEENLFIQPKTIGVQSILKPCLCCFFQEKISGWCWEHFNLSSTCCKIHNLNSNPVKASQLIEEKMIVQEVITKYEETNLTIHLPSDTPEGKIINSSEEPFDSPQDSGICLVNDDQRKYSKRDQKDYANCNPGICYVSQPIHININSTSVSPPTVGRGDLAFHETSPTIIIAPIAINLMSSTTSSRQQNKVSIHCPSPGVTSPIKTSSTKICIVKQNKKKKKIKKKKDAASNAGLHSPSSSLSNLTRLRSGGNIDSTGVLPAKDAKLPLGKNIFSTFSSSPYEYSPSSTSNPNSPTPSVIDLTIDHILHPSSDDYILQHHSSCNKNTTNTNTCNTTNIFLNLPVPSLLRPDRNSVNENGKTSTRRPNVHKKIKLLDGSATGASIKLPPQPPLLFAPRLTASPVKSLPRQDMAHNVTCCSIVTIYNISSSSSEDDGEENHHPHILKIVPEGDEDKVSSSTSRDARLSPAPHVNNNSCCAADIAGTPSGERSLENLVNYVQPSGVNLATFPNYTLSPSNRISNLNISSTPSTPEHGHPSGRPFMLRCHLCSHVETFESLSNPPKLSINQKIAQHCLASHKNVQIHIEFSEENMVTSRVDHPFENVVTPTFIVDCYPSRITI